MRGFGAFAAAGMKNSPPTQPSRRARRQRRGRDVGTAQSYPTPTTPCLQAVVRVPP